MWKVRGGVFPPKYFIMLYGSIFVATTIFYIYNRRMLSQILTQKKRYILYFGCKKSVTSVNIADGFSLVVVNNTLLATNIFIALQK